MSNVVNLDETTRRLVHYTKFIGRHPEYAGFIAILMGVVTICRDANLQPPGIDLEKAHLHLYGPDGCTRCVRLYEERRDYENKHGYPPRIYG